MSKKRAFNSQGYVNVNGDPYSAGEPTWDDWETLSPQQFKNRVGNMFNFYSQHVSKSDLKNDFFKWLSSTDKYKRDQVRKAKKHYDERVSFTAAKIARCINLGMPLDHPHLPEHREKTIGLLEAEASTLISYADSHPDDEDDEQQNANDSENSVKPKSPAEKLRDSVTEKVRPAIQQWLDAETVQEISFHHHLESHEVPQRGCSIVRELINQEINKCDSEESLKKKDSTRRLRNLNHMLTDTDKYHNRLKENKAKKTRKKPSSRAEMKKQIEKVQYQHELSIRNADGVNYGDLYSVDPIVLAEGVSSLYVYNSKYKKIVYYQAPKGKKLGIKGTTIQGFSTKNSYTRILRDPKSILKRFLDQSVDLDTIEAELKKEKTKTNIPTGRLNQNTIILKAVK